MANTQFIVVCTDTDEAGDSAYHLATRQVFPTRELAERYRATINTSRYAHVIEGRFNQLRFENS